MLANSTRPILPYGPYQIKKRSQQEIILSSNSAFIFGDPMIPVIVIKIYSNEDKLISALKRKEIMAVYNPNGDFLGLNTYDLNLQKRIALFFNLEKAPWNDVNLRKKIMNNEPLSEAKTLTITTANDNQLIAKLDELKNDYKSLNVNVETVIVDPKKLKEEIIPTRNYEALLFGIDYGRDPDPYPFWHSSQISEKGGNLSNFRNKDADMLLEQALIAIKKEDRDKKYASFQTIYNKEIPAILFDKITNKYFVSDKIKDIKIGYGVVDSDRYYNIWQWYINTKKSSK